MIRCAARLEVVALPGVPVVRPGDDLAELVWLACARAGIALADGDVVVLCSKLLSRAEGRFVDLARVEPGARARGLARATGVDPRLVELVLRESSSISRAAPGARAEATEEATAGVPLQDLADDVGRCASVLR